MKRSLFLAIFCLISTLLFAQPHYHSVSFKSVPGGRFYIYVDGMQQNKNAVASLTINNVPDGLHQITVILDVKNHPQSFYQFRMNGWDLFYDIEITGDPRVQYMINFKQTAPFNFPVELVKNFNNHGQSAYVAPPQPNYPPANHPDPHQGQPGPQPGQPGHPGPQSGYPNQQPGNYGHPGQQPVPQGHHGNYGGHHPQGGAPQVMPCPEPEFAMIKHSISKETFSSDQMKAAKRAIPGHNLTAMQIRDLALIFTFDSDRVTFLKYAYRHCFDPQNYYVVYDVLTFESSKDEVERAIRR